MPGKVNPWARADEDDDDEENTPNTQNESSGIKERVKYGTNAKGQKIKITQKVRVREAKIKVPLRVESRKNLPKFGLAKTADLSVTTIAGDAIFVMEHPDDQGMEEKDEPLLLKNTQNFRVRQLDAKLMELENEMAQEEEVEEEEVAAPSNKPGGYVPPAKRQGATTAPSSSGDGTENTLRVSNLTKQVTEEDLRDLFGRFGNIHRVSLPKLEDPKTGEKVPRGFAYIAFSRRDDAERAMNRLQGHGYDHLILKIEWAKPTKENSNPGMASTFYSGYGKQLAQDTTEKVFFSSTRKEEA